jgi:hypothetical protein
MFGIFFFSGVEVDDRAEHFDMAEDRFIWPS